MTKLLTLLSATAFASVLAAQGQEKTVISTPQQKPAWRADMSLGVKESYDSNVYLEGSTPAPGYEIQPGSAAGLRNVGSFVTTISPKIGIDLAPLLGDREALQTLSLAYVPDYSFYHNAPQENNEAHRFVTSIKAKGDGVSFNWDNTFLYVDGNKYGPTYPGDLISAWGIVAPRERREQIQDRSTAIVKFSLGQWFFRPTASLLYYDLMTRHIAAAAPGYLNFVNRSDVYGGADVGYELTHEFAITLGYRYGAQSQQELFDNPVHSSSDYQRVLMGLEGKPWKWLDVKIQGGPDFRNYNDNAPVNDKHRITYYGDATVAASISANDTLTFKYKGWQWVSCIGYIPYFDSNYDLKYQRKLSDKIDLDLDARLMTANYDMGNLIKRNDLEYSVSAGIDYAFNSHASVNLTYALNLGRSGENSVNNVPEEQFNQELVSLGAVLKF